ncbi:translation elongation factor Ts [Candidatus Azoamicus ciliaticola]|uniref:Elongation factor Ts n=1 Tax=Candidatus Azoamicus ciliaticola TaxID=2652803 RepID=A0A6J5JZQ8_9GAMM|nr:translation elongation factor Ts [Candidatus Azoamicus ciliaticola]CAB3976460.1 Elongation factor Ts [Candidatus Azoamicus ciliaticola]
MSDFLNNVKKLRELTGISIIDCKKALLESNNDVDLAVIYLRKSGASIMESKSNRQANNGVISIFIDESKHDGVMLEVNCETDFVAKSSDFLDYVDKLCKYFVSNDFLGKNFIMNDDKIVLNKELNDLKIDLILKLRENLILKRVVKFFSQSNFLFSYLHFDNKLGVILNIDKDDNFLAKEILIQIASMKPKYLNIFNIPEDELLSEKQISFDKLKNKYPEKSLDLLTKMVDGQINKFYSDNVLLEQDFVKDNKKKLKQVIASRCNIISFTTFCLGNS